MIRKLVLGLVLGLVFTLSGCSSVSQEEFDALNTQKTELESQKAVLEGEVDTLTSEKTTLQSELDAKMVSYSDQSVASYGYTHGGYVGQVTIVVLDG